MRNFGSKGGIKLPSGVFNTLMTRTENLLGNLEESVALSVGSVFLNQSNTVKNLNDLRSKASGKSLLLTGLSDISSKLKNLLKPDNKSYKSTYNLIKESTNYLKSLTSDRDIVPNTQINYTEQLDAIVKHLEENKDKNINTGEIILNITGLDKKSIDSIIELSKLKLSENSVIDTNVAKNISKFIMSIYETFDNLNKFNESNVSENIQKLTQYFTYLNDLFKLQTTLYNNSIEAVEANKKVNEALDTITETAVNSSEHIDDVNTGTNSLTDITKFVIASGVIMLIGSLFMSDKRIIDSMKFGITLALFITAILLPIELMKRISKDKDLSYVDNLKGFVITCGFVMLLGAAIMMIPGIFKGALQFGFALSLFIASILLPMMLYSKFSKDIDKSLKELCIFVITASTVMMLGALFVMLGGGKIVINALVYTILLSTFITGLLLPILVFSILSPKAMEGLKQITIFVIVASTVMMIGALFVTLGGGQMAINALVFTILLSTFITGILLPIVIFSLIAPHAMRGLKQVAIFVIVAAVTMMIGALFVSDIKNVVNAILFTAVLSLFIFGVLLPFNIFSKNINTASKTIMQVSILIGVCAAIMMIGALFIEKYGVKSVLLFISTLIGFVALMGLVMIGLYALKKFIKPGIAIAKGMAIAIALLGASLFIVSFAMKNFTVEDGVKFLASVVVLTGVILLLGTSGPIALAIGIGVAVVTAMSLVFLLLSYTFDTVHTVVDKNDPQADFIKMYNALKESESIFLLLTANTLNIMLSIPAVGMLTAVLTLLSISFALLHAVAKNDLVKSVKTLNNAMINMGDLFNTINDKLPGAVGLLKLMGKLLLVKELAYNINIIFGYLTDSIADYAELKVATEWNILGKPIRYRLLTQNDFKTASEGISTILTTISAGINKTITDNKWMFEDNFYSKLMKVHALALTEGNILSILSLALQDYASLKIATEWNSLGIATDYRMLTKNDFKNASENISIVMLTLAKAITQTYKSNDKLFGNEGYGILFKVRELAITEGKILSTLSEGLQSYAQLKIPVQWNESGKATMFRELNYNDFINAATNISAVMMIIANSIASVWTGNGFEIATSTGTVKINGIGKGLKDLDGGLFGDSVEDIFKTFLPIGELISAMTEGISAYSQLMFPTAWDEKGKPISFTKLQNKDFTDAGLNISKVLLATLFGNVDDINNINKDNITSGVVGAYNKLKDNEIENDIKKIIESMTPVGNLISGISNGIQSYAKLQIPIKWDNTGKPIDYQILTDADFNNVGINIAKIITCVGNAIVDVYKSDNFKQTFNKDGEFGKAITAISGIGNVIKNIVDGIQSYSNLIIPTEWDSNGKPIKYKQITNDDIISAQDKIKLLLCSVGTAFVDAYNGTNLPKDKHLLPLSELTTMDYTNAIAQKSKSMLSIIKNFADMLEKISKLIIPTGFDKDGKATGYTKLTIKDITDAASNIQTIIEQIPQAIYNAYDLHKETLFSQDAQYIISLGSVIPNIVNIINTSLDGVSNISDNIKNINNIFAYKSKYTGSIDSNITISMFKDIYGILSELTVLTSVLNSMSKNIEVYDASIITANLTDIADTITSLSTLSDKLSLVIDSTITILNNYNKYVATVNTTSFDTIINVINSSIDFISSIVNTILNNSLINGFNINTDLLYSQLNNEIVKINTTVTLLFTAISNIYNTFESNKLNINKFNNSLIGESSIINNLIYDINNFINNISQNININDNINSLNKLFDFINLFKYVLIDDNNGLLIIINDLILNINRINTLLSSNTINNSKLSITERLKPIIDDINNTTLLLSSFNSNINNLNGYEIIDLTGKSLNVLADGISKILFEMSKAQENTTFKKNIIQLEKFINNTVNKIDVEKIDKLTNLIMALNQLAERTTNLDALTDAIANNLTEVLQLLSAKMDEAKGTFEVMDEIQKHRHDLINKSIEKIKDILVQQITVHVSAETPSTPTIQNTNTPDNGSSNNLSISGSNDRSIGGDSMNNSNNSSSILGSSNRQQNTGKKYNTSSTDSLLNNIYRELCKITHQ